MASFPLLLSFVERGLFFVCVLPFVALDSATATGPGGSVDLGGVSNEFTLHVVTTGEPTGWNVGLQGSHDNVNWFTLLSATSNQLPPRSTTISRGELPSGTPDAEFMHFARYVRANLFVLTGGTGPTVTATVAVGEVK